MRQPLAHLTISSGPIDLYFLVLLIDYLLSATAGKCIINKRCNGCLESGNTGINGALTIDSAFTCPTVDGLNGEVLTTDGTGSVLVNLSAPGDNLGNHLATENLQTNGYYISNDGDNRVYLFMIMDGFQLVVIQQMLCSR